MKAVLTLWILVGGRRRRQKGERGGEGWGRRLVVVWSHKSHCTFLWFNFLFTSTFSDWSSSWLSSVFSECGDYHADEDGRVSPSLNHLSSPHTVICLGMSSSLLIHFRGSECDCFACVEETNVINRPSLHSAGITVWTRWTPTLARCFSLEDKLCEKVCVPFFWNYLDWKLHKKEILEKVTFIGRSNFWNVLGVKVYSCEIPAALLAQT